MKIKEAREHDDTKLNEELSSLRKKLFTLRTQGVTQQIEDPSQVGKIRRDIARILTVQGERARTATKAATK
jgi:large subunit ribosomal protein L29